MNNLTLVVVGIFIFQYCLSAENTTYRPCEHPAKITKNIQVIAQPRRSMVVSSEIAGRVESIAVDLGAVVGDNAVFQVDDRRAKIRYQQLQQQKKEAEHQLAKLQLNLKKVNTEVVYQQKEQTRSLALKQSGGSSQQELDALAHGLEQLEIQGEELEIALKTQALAIDSLDLDILNQQDHLERHQGRAPKNWKVVQRYKEPGEMVQMGEPILKCVDTQTLLVELFLDEVECEALPSIRAHWLNSQKPCSLKLFYLAPEVNLETRKRKTLLLMENPQPQDCGRELLVGLAWTDSAQGWMIPLNYVVENFGQMWVMNSDNKLLPLKNIHKTQEGWVAPPEAFTPQVQLIIPTGSMNSPEAR
jgi:hypothetical protein